MLTFDEAINWFVLIVRVVITCAVTYECGYSKEPSRRDYSYQHSASMFKVLDMIRPESMNKRLFILTGVSFSTRNICYVCSKELPRRDCSSQHSNQMFKVLDGNFFSKLRTNICL